MVKQARKQRNRRLLFLSIALVVILGSIAVSYLDARVGGGHGYSGRKGGGGGGGGDGFIIYLLLRLIIRHPYIGIPVAAIVIVFYVRSRKNNPEPDELLSSIQTAHVPLPLNSAVRDRQVAALQKDDPKFSLPLFLDFTQVLYANVMHFGAKQQIGKLKAFLSDPVITQFKSAMMGVKKVEHVIVGQCAIMGINLTAAEENYITLAYETNYTTHMMDSDKPKTFFENSVWTLARKKGVVSKGPGDMNKIGCPSCGGALDDNVEAKCMYCGTEFHNGTMTWYVKSVSVIEKSVRSRDVKGGYAQETGTMRPTMYHPTINESMAAFRERYPDFDENAFLERVKNSFIMLQEAWGTRNWEKARSLETDYLFQLHLYWINIYKKEQVRNVLKDVKVNHIQIVKLLSDAYYDALTVRIYAAMIDYTETDAGKHIGGDMKNPRMFSEYWTFIRRTGVKENPKRLDQCPNCGNELSIGMVGKCNQCGSKITTGEFGWVLSLIEQDESYAG